MIMIYDVQAFNIYFEGSILSASLYFLFITFFVKYYLKKEPTIINTMVPTVYFFYIILAIKLIIKKCC
jgi:hypothetical protein